MAATPKAKAQPQPQAEDLRRVVLDLDRPRVLRCNFNALSHLEEQVPGLKALDIEALWDVITSNSITVKRAVLWSQLLSDDPDLTLERTGELMELKQFREVSTAIAKSVLVSMSDDPERIAAVHAELDTLPTRNGHAEPEA